MESSLSISNMQDPSSSLLEKQQKANGNGDLDSGRILFCKSIWLWFIDRYLTESVQETVGQYL